MKRSPRTSLFYMAIVPMVQTNYAENVNFFRNRRRDALLSENLQSTGCFLLENAVK